MSRADEIAQGLRSADGALTFALVVFEYNQGHEDFEAGAPRPDVTTPSYDLGRWRAQEKAEVALDAERVGRTRETNKDDLPTKDTHQGEESR